MRISWFLGFGWLSILTVVACGIAINRLNGPFVWVLYVPFLVVALYMTARFKLFNAQPWRRVHHRAMLTYAKLAGQEYDDAKLAGREYDIKVPCRELALQLFGTERASEIDSLLGDGRKAYFKALVEAYPHVFVKGMAVQRHGAILQGVQRDIQASELGPDVVIARDIERKLGRLEAANYFQALLLGQVR